MRSGLSFSALMVALLPFGVSCRHVDGIDCRQIDRPPGANMHARCGYDDRDFLLRLPPALMAQRPCR